MSKNCNLLFASVDIGWRISLYKKFLSKKRRFKQIDSFVKYKVPKSQYKTEYTFQFQFKNYPSIIQWLISSSFFIYSLIKYNTFYFLSGETILTRRLRKFEFKIYKLLGKRVIMHFVGTDIRNLNYLMKKNENLSDFLERGPNSIIPLDWQKELILDSIKFADSILVSTPDLLHFVPKAKYYPVMIDLDKFNHECKIAEKNSDNNYFKSNKIKVLHAPSNPKVKGSNAIDRILKKVLKSNTEIEYLNTSHLNRETGTVYSISRYELFQLYNEADIVIDQMVIGWYGLQSIEALLANCKVICHIEENLKQYLYPDCPISAADINELESTLLNAIDEVKNKNINYTSQIKWVKRYHVIDNNNRYLKDAIGIA